MQPYKVSFTIFLSSLMSMLSSNLIWVHLENSLWWPARVECNDEHSPLPCPIDSSSLRIVQLFGASKSVAIDILNSAISKKFEPNVEIQQHIPQHLLSLYQKALTEVSLAALRTSEDIEKSTLPCEKISSELDSINTSNDEDYIPNTDTSGALPRKRSRSFSNHNSSLLIDNFSPPIILPPLTPIPSLPSHYSPVKKRQDVLEWDDYFMSVAFLSAMRSKDPSTQVGACIVNNEKRIVGIGYNGFPRGCSDDELPWSRCAEDELDTKYPYVCHAEVNAILNKNSADVRGCTMYVALFPCNECAKIIIQSGINEVVYLSDKYQHTPSMKASRRMLDMAKVKYRMHIPKREEVGIHFHPISLSQPNKL